MIICAGGGGYKIVSWLVWFFGGINEKHADDNYDAGIDIGSLNHGNQFNSFRFLSHSLDE